MKRSYMMGSVAVVAVVLIAIIFGVLSSNKNSDTVDGSLIAREAPSDLGLAYLENGEYEQAIKYYSNQIVVESDNPEYFFQRGQAFVGLAQYESALNDFTEAIRLNGLGLSLLSY